MTKFSHIEQLIQDLCPSGVEYKTLAELLDYEQPTKYIVRSTEYDDRYKTPVLTAGQGFILGYTDETDGIYHASKENPTLIFDDFTTSYHWVDFDFKVKSSAMKMLRPRKDADIVFRYVYYAMLGIDYKPEEHARQWISRYGAFEIPVPPLPVQKEIVRIVDTFDNLIKNIDAEIDARQRQLSNAIECLYNDVKDNWQEKSLSDIGQIIKGSGILKSDFVEVGRPCIHYGQIHTYYTTYAKKTKSFISEKLYAKSKKAKTGDLVIATTSEDVPACCKATAWLGTEDVAVSGDAHILHHNQDPLFMAYLFRTERFSEQRAMAATGAKVTSVSGDRLASFRFFFPPLAEQHAIAEKLDTIEAFINNLKTERDLRQQQYEYYREHLINLLK
jgi:type I restriction enzyme S subunit